MRVLTKRLLLMIVVFAGVLSMGGPCGAYDEEPWGGIVEQSQAAFRPHWSADDQAIIFRGLPQDGLQSLEAWADGSVYRVGLDGASLNQIAKEAYWLDVSPTGDRISFTTTPHREDEYRLESARQDGSDRRRLTDAQGFATVAVLSPDGTRIAFHQIGYDDAGVYIMESDGSDLQRFPVFETHEDSYTEGEVLSHFESERPVWSPDGRTLAFVIRERAGSYPDYSRTDVLYTFRIDGSELTEVFRTPPIDHYSPNIFEPAWSPDGGRLAFVQASGRDSALNIISADGSDLRRLVPTLNKELLERLNREVPKPSSDVLSWSPKGSEILFELKTRNLNLIYVVDVESGRYQRLAPGLAASWSPDGSRIAVLGADFYPDDESLAYEEGPCGVGDDVIAPGHPYLYTMARDGSDVRGLVWRDGIGTLDEANPRPFWPWAEWQPC